jgi:outer membrane murein-binding lipoprotein Lpp
LKLKIKNFQSINDVELDIGPVTVLTGPSDIGKSAIIRALYLLHRNQGGLELVKHGKAQLSVQQIMDDGSTVSIVKGKGINSYLIGDKSFSKIGRDIPEEVSLTLRTQELPLDKDQSLDLNFSRQFDSPFLLSDSTAIVTKAISSLSGINIVYSAIREGLAEYQKEKLKVEIVRGVIRDKAKYDSLSSEVDDLKSSLAAIDALCKDLERVKGEVVHNESLLARLEAAKSRDINLGPLLELIGRFESDFAAVNSSRAYLFRLESMHFDYSTTSEYVASQEFELNLSSFNDKLDNLSHDVDIINSRDKETGAWSNLLARVETLGSLVASTDTSIKEVSAEVTKLESQVKVCKTCGRPL